MKHTPFITNDAVVFGMLAVILDLYLLALLVINILEEILWHCTFSAFMLFYTCDSQYVWHSRW